MITERFFGTPTVAALKKGLQCASVRQQAIANNIANVSTPGYKRQVVKFEDELWKAMGGNGFQLKTTHPMHYNGGSRGIGDIQPKVEVDKATSIRVDQNTVNIDQEMVDLTRNSGQFAQRAEILNRLYSQLRMAIRGEGR